MKESELYNNPIIEDEEGGEHEFEAPLDPKDTRTIDEYRADMWSFLKDLNGGKMGYKPANANQNNKPFMYYFALEKELKSKKAMGVKVEELPEYKELQEYKEKNKAGAGYDPYYKKGGNAGVNEGGNDDANENQSVDDSFEISLKNGNAIFDGDPGEKKDPVLDDDVRTPSLDPDDYTVESMSVYDLAHNQDQISRLYSFLDSKDKWYKGSSPNFRELMSDLKKLKKLSSQLVKERADKGRITDPEKLKEIEKKERSTMAKYLKQAELVEKRAEFYLANKKDNITSPYAQSRFDAVTDFKEAIAKSRSSMEKAFKDEDAARLDRVRIRREKERFLSREKKKLADWKKNKFNKYSVFNGSKDNRNVYFGKDFVDENLDKIKMPVSFSLSRTAGISMANAVLMCEKGKNGADKYSIDDILDPSKLQEEKRKAFKDLVERMQRYNDEDKQYIAELLFKGAKKTREHMGQLLKNVDFDDPDYIYSDNFTKCTFLASQAFDMWQEESRIPDEMSKAVAKLDKNIKSFAEYHEKIAMGRGYLDQFLQNINRVADRVEAISAQDNPEADVVLVSNSFTVHKLRDLFAKKAKECRNKPYEDWFSYKDGEIGRGIYMQSATDLAIVLDTAGVQTGKLIKNNLASFLDGTAFKNMDYTYEPGVKEPVKIKGMIDFSIMDEDDYLRSLSSHEIYRRANCNIKHLDDLKRSSDPEIQGYLNRGIRALTKLTRYSADPDGMSYQDKKTAKECIKDIFACHAAVELKKMGATGEELKRESDNLVKQLPAYKRYTDAIGHGAMTGLIIGNITDVVAGSEASILAKGKIAKNKLENGGYRKDREMVTGFAYAYATALKQETGKLPYNPKTPGRRYSLQDYVDKMISDAGKDKTLKRNLQRMKEEPGFAKELLSNKNGLKHYITEDETKFKQQRQAQNAAVNDRQKNAAGKGMNNKK